MSKHHLNARTNTSAPRPNQGGPSVQPNPYGFIPVEPQQAVLDRPLWRDGKSQEQRCSGELLLTLEALTPLLVGNQQRKIDDKHSELVPHMLDDGRVLLAGSSLKGMLRAALASLLQAPMERVAEHHYSYRPNFGFGPDVEIRAAIVERVDGKDENAEVTVRLLPAQTSVVFVRHDAYDKLGKPKPGKVVTGDKIFGLEITGNSPRQRLVCKPGAMTTFDHVLFDYSGGIDGAGHLARAFNNGKTYHHVLIRKTDIANARTVKIPATLYQAYLRTQEVLADDRHGHLSSGHPLASGGKLDVEKTRKSIHQNAALRPNQLIYIECEVSRDPQGRKNLRYLTMGHHFQYRWAYTSSVRYRNTLLGDDQKELRPELALRPEEKANDQGAPEQLSAARLLFGYTVDGNKEDQKNLARDNFKRLAGRIACNHALEVTDGKGEAERFIAGGPIQLKILGMPRPSAVEFYLKQPKLPRELTTYGDIPSEPGGDLAGRKFYRHQPDAKTDTWLYEGNKRDANTSERGTVVRYLSQPGSRFRFTLRFDSLRLWELGALLAVLEPQKLEKRLSLPTHTNGYAHKLGYGKPLGLGSIRLKIDGARWYENDSWQWNEARNLQTEAWQTLHNEALTALQERLQHTWGGQLKPFVERWLKTRRWTELGNAAYPTWKNRDGDMSIYEYHTSVRRRHAEIRRGQKKKYEDKNIDFGSFEVPKRMETK
jgi:CRISPR-associated protein (TIGR03986 family)